MRKPIGITVPHREVGYIEKSTVDSTGTAAVDPDYFWRPIETCPRGVKVQLLGDGVAIYGIYKGEKFYSNWAPLPKLKRN